MAVVGLFLLPSQSFAEELVFNWHLPSAASVQSFQMKDGHSAKTSYRMSAVEQANGRVVVSFSDFEFQELDGKKVNNGDISPQVRALSALIPAFEIDKASGEIVGMIGFETMLAEVSDAINSPAEKEKMTAFLTSPMVSGVLAAKSQELWNAMVATWVGLDIAEGEVLKGNVDIPAGQIAIPTMMTYRNEGIVTSDPLTISMRLKTSQQGPEFETALGQMIGQMARQAGRSEEEIARMNLKGSKKTGEVSSVLSPNTLRPSRVEIYEISEVFMDGKKAGQNERRNILTFDWD